MTYALIEMCLLQVRGIANIMSPLCISHHRAVPGSGSL